MIEDVKEGSRRPALIRKTEGAVVAENNVVKDGNADEVAGLTEPGGKHTVFGTGFRFSGGMIVGADDGGAIQENGGFKDFTGMDDAERQGADGNNVDADDGVFGIETGDKELFAIERGKERTEDAGGRAGIAEDKKRRSGAFARHETETCAVCYRVLPVGQFTFF